MSKHPSIPLVVAIFILISVMCLPTMAIAQSQKVLTKNTYFKIIKNDISSPIKSYIYSCDERLDLDEAFNGDVPVTPEDEGYIHQYDPLISASALCYGHSVAGLITSYIGRRAYDLSDITNTNGTPMQVWEAVIFCYDIGELEGTYGGDPLNIPENLRSVPHQVILHCLDHTALPSE